MRRIVLIAIGAAVIPAALAMIACTGGQSPDLTAPDLGGLDATAMVGQQPGQGGGGQGGGGRGGGRKPKLNVMFEGDVSGQGELSGKNDGNRIQADGYFTWTFGAYALPDPNETNGVCNEFIYAVLSSSGESDEWAGDLNLDFSLADLTGLARMSTDSGGYFINLLATVNSEVTWNDSDPDVTSITVVDGAVSVVKGKGRNKQQSKCSGINYDLKVSK